MGGVKNTRVKTEIKENSKWKFVNQNLKSEKTELKSTSSVWNRKEFTL